MGLSAAGNALLQLATTALGLGIAIAVLPGATTDGLAPVLGVAAVVALGVLVLRYPLRLLASRIGAVGALVGGVAAQILVLWLALWLIPGVEVDGPQTVVGLLLLAGIFMAAARWLVAVNDSAYVLGDLLRRARARARRAGIDLEPGGDRPPGLLLVQLDGVGREVLGQAIEAGLAPTMHRWLRQGSHQLASWWARVPSATPASQAALLFGDASRIPTFRWWDRELGRMLVANRPADAAIIEQRITQSPDAAPLLGPDDVAVSMMFSGGAGTTVLVMSRSTRTGGAGPGTSFLRMFASPFVFFRSLALTFGEMAKELFQAHRQRVRGVEPRISRGGWYVPLRGATNVLLRDLNTSVVAEHLVKGAPVVVVDLVDYDEVAHHAGPLRPEATRSLEGIDRVLGLLEQVAAVAPREYRIVVFSDHGQSLGATFRDAYGTTLQDLVAQLSETASVEDERGEESGPLNALLAAVFPTRGGIRKPPPAPQETGREVPEAVVVGAGNLGSIWFPRFTAPLTLEAVRSHWPRLVPGLAAHPGIGLVVARTEQHGPLAMGADGLVWLETGETEGVDPLLTYPTRARADLLRTVALPEAPDLLVVSAVSAMGHVHAFEHQVGSHGGLGGPQNEAFLLHPAGPLDADLLEPVDGRVMLVGGEQVHQQLRRWIGQWGVRG